MKGRNAVSDETLAAFAGGRLDEGLALVVAAHVEANPAAAGALREVEAIAGGLLHGVDPVTMAGSAREVLKRRRQASSPPAARADTATERNLPRVLAPYKLGKWRRIGLKVEMRRVEVPDAEARVFMLRAGPGVWLPQHRHTGLEWTTILAGAYEHEHGRYVAGDFDEADQEHEHHPRVDAREGCTCLVALTGDVVFQGWLGRLLQPLVRL